LFAFRPFDNTFECSTSDSMIAGVMPTSAPASFGSTSIVAGAACAAAAGAEVGCNVASACRA